MLSDIMNFDDQFYISGGYTPRKQFLFHGVVYDGHVNGSIETIWEWGAGMVPTLRSSFSPWGRFLFRIENVSCHDVLMTMKHLYHQHIGRYL